MDDRDTSRTAGPKKKKPAPGPAVNERIAVGQALDAVDQALEPGSVARRLTGRRIDD